MKSLRKVEHEQKRYKTAKTVFQPAFGRTQHPKAGQNTQQQISEGALLEGPDF